MGRVESVVVKGDMDPSKSRSSEKTVGDRS